MEEQIEKLIKENEELKKQIEELKEENEYLWLMLEEQKSSHKSIGQAIQSMLQDAIEDEMLKKMKPVGEA